MSECECFITQDAEGTLRQAGIRPTRQRVALAELIRDGGRRHLTPDSTHQEALAAGLQLSLATVYNTLHEFSNAGLIRRVAVGERSWFCTCADDHHHFYDEGAARLYDITGNQPKADGLPQAPEGYAIAGVDVIVRLKRVG